MAEFLSKTSLISSWNSHKQRHHCRTSVVPKNLNCNTGVSSAVRRFPSLKLKSQVLGSSSSSTQSEFYGTKIVFRVVRGIPCGGNPQYRAPIAAQMGRRFGEAQKWWEKRLQPNMREVTSAIDLVDSLLNAGDKLVIVDFFSPACPACRALHPKICQFAEKNPDVQFLLVNNEEHASMCNSLHVLVIPFFRFYRGAPGRLRSFYCTILTIKKFKDALDKHTPERCSLGPAKGLEEKELLAMSANRNLSFTYTRNPVQPANAIPTEEDLPGEATLTQPLDAPAQEELVAEVKAEGEDAPDSPPPSSRGRPLAPKALSSSEVSKERTLMTAGR